MLDAAEGGCYLFSVLVELGLDAPHAAVHLSYCVLRLLLAALDKIGDFPGGNGGTLRELPDLVRDDCETEPLISRFCGLDRRIQGKEVRLLGDVVDHLDDPTDVLDLRAQRVYAVSDASNSPVDLVHARSGLVYGD